LWEVAPTPIPSIKWHYADWKYCWVDIKRPHSLNPSPQQWGEGLFALFPTVGEGLGMGSFKEDYLYARLID